MTEKQEFIKTIQQLEFDYNKDMIQYLSKDNETKIKTILYFIADVIKHKKRIPQKFNTRTLLIYTYDKCKEKEREYMNTSHQIVCFYDYYHKSMIAELY